jgi:hypothetical protein
MKFFDLTCGMTEYRSYLSKFMPTNHCNTTLSWVFQVGDFVNYSHKSIMYHTLQQDKDNLLSEGKKNELFHKGV